MRGLVFGVASLMVAFAGPPAGAQELIWSIRLGTAGNDYAASAASDGSASGFFVAGGSDADFAGPNAGGYDAWLGRFDGAGAPIWLRQFGSNLEDSAHAVALDPDGGVFAAGGTYGVLGGPNSGGRDIWLARYDGDGNQEWIVQFGTAEDEAAWALTADGSGGVFVGGYTTGVLGMPSGGSSAAWLARYDGTGVQLWIRQYAPALLPLGGTLGLALDGSGGVFSVGWAFPDAWVARHDGEGTEQWLQVLSGVLGWGWPQALAARPDGAGGLFAAGRMDGSLGTQWPWLARYDSAGSRLWLRSDFGPPMSVAHALAPDGGDGLFIGGSFLARVNNAGALIWSAPNILAPIRALATAGPRGVYTVATTTSSPTDVVLARYGPCYANCDENPEPPLLNVADFACFLQRFAAAEPYANCDRSTTPPVLNVADFACFLQKFAAGCP